MNQKISDVRSIFNQFETLAGSKPTGLKATIGFVGSDSMEVQKRTEDAREWCKAILVLATLMTVSIFFSLEKSR